MAANKSFSIGSDEKIAEYVETLFQVETPFSRDVRDRAQAAGLPNIHISGMDGQHLEVLVSLCGAKKAVEIGTLAGYSGSRIAGALPPDGILHTFEFHAHHAVVAEETFRSAGLLDRVKIHVGAALDLLPSIESEGPYDFVFIDADKVSMPAYFQWARKNIRVGGVIVGDNTFGWGNVWKSEAQVSSEPSVLGIQKFNQLLACDPNFKTTILPTGEGMTVGVRLR